MTHLIKFIDLFAGIGGFRLAFEQAKYCCIYSCEINEACQKAYYQNFGDLPENDITQLEINQIPDHDVLTAGFPCQPFSISGKRNGFNDTRGTLFFHLCEIMEAKKPKVAVLENVKHLLHLDQGRTLDTILYSLEDLGYLVDYKLLNAKDFGLPQNRERIIIIASLNGKFNFDLIKKNLATPNLENYLDTEGEFEYLDPNEYTLIEHPKKQQSGLIFVGYRNKNIWKTGIRANTEHLSRVHRQPNRIYSIEGVHPTLPSQETSGRFFIYLPQENAVRKLSINECYRIMGFPDQFKRHPNLGECYKQIGNSVCIPMIYEIAVQIKKQNLLQDHSNSHSTEELYRPLKPIQLEILGLTTMNHKEKLLQSYHVSDNLNNLKLIEQRIPKDCLKFIHEIALNSTKQKGVYTVLITLLVHKVIEPNQDIRYHQSNMQGGFSGRTIDTQYITPTLKELGLPAMAESGWLTRSLEQPYPYTLDYNGKINNKVVKKAFLELIHFIQYNPQQAEDILVVLLSKVKEVAESQVIKIIKLENSDKFEIQMIIDCLESHFFYNYKTHGASKLPVLAFFAIYQQIIEEVERYRLCNLKRLNSHTSSDEKSKSAGDIEILDKNNNLIEAIEIKHGKTIDLNMIRIAKDKIIRFNPRRYYIFSSVDIKFSETDKINEEIHKIKQEHGCQIIVNGILPTIKYYLRLINSLDDFINNYSKLIELDKELQAIHKLKWNEILSNLE